MSNASCSCGALTLAIAEPATLTVACHCRDCQRRTGAAFGVGVFYPAGAVTVSGTAKEFTRMTGSGGTGRIYFCPNCGSSVYWKVDKLPALVAVALGALDGPEIPVPDRSVFEQSRHAWVQLDGPVARYPQSSVASDPDGAATASP